MGFEADAQAIEAVMRGRDPAFSAVPAATLDTRIAALWAAVDADRDGFLLAAMRAVAVAGNAHSRVIPNGAISVLPRRVIVRDGRMAMVVGATVWPIRAVNDVSVAALLDRFAPYLAGNAARQRVLSGIMLVWPAALSIAEVQGPHYRFALDGAPDQVLEADEVVGACDLYPVSDSGAITPLAARPYDLQLEAGLSWLRLADLKALTTDDVTDLLKTLSPRTQDGLVIDLRGNPGGSFLTAMPLIDWVGTAWRGRTCAILVDHYTFSAGIVVAVLLAHRTGDRARLMGADMGDTLDFWAEGDTLDLAASGALLRYSAGWHDWATGRADATTPPEIATHMVGMGDCPVEPVPYAMQEAAARATARGA